MEQLGLLAHTMKMPCLATAVTCQMVIPMGASGKRSGTMVAVWTRCSGFFIVRSCCKVQDLDMQK